MSDILNQKTRTFFDTNELFKQSAKTFAGFEKVSFPEIKKTPAFKNNVYYGETIRGMTHVSPLVERKLYNQSSNQIFNKYFIDAENHQKENINVITDPGIIIRNGFEFNIINYFFDDNNNKKFGDDGDRLAFKLLLFVSTNGLKVKECYEVTEPQNDELILFLETDTELSKQVLFAKMSKEVQKKFVDSEGHLKTNVFNHEFMEGVRKHYPDADQKIIEELLKKGYIEESIIKQGFLGVFHYILKAIGAIPKIVGWIVEKLGDAVDFLKIDEAFWDTENEDYFLKKENVIEHLSLSKENTERLERFLENKEDFALFDLIPDFVEKTAQFLLQKIKGIIERYNSIVKQQIEALYESLNNPTANTLFQNTAVAVAFIAGLRNGIVDFISSILKFAGTTLQILYDNPLNDYETQLEYLDNFWDAIWSAEFWENLWESTTTTYHKIVDSLNNLKLEDFNWVRIAYFSGFGLANIASFFIPVTQIAKAGKLGEIITKFTQEISSGFTKATAVITEKTTQAYQAAIKAFSEIITLISEGGTKLKKFFENIWQKIVDWFIKNSKLVRKVANVANEFDLLKLAKANRIKVLAQEVQTILKITNGRKDLAEAILLSLKEVVEGKSILQLVRKFGIKEIPAANSLSNYQARIWYTWRKMQIEKVISKIKNLEDKAKKAFELRNEYRTATRQYMKDRKLAEYLEQVEKNMEWDILLKKTLKKDKINSMEEAYEYIIETSRKGRDGVDILFKINK